MAEKPKTDNLKSFDAYRDENGQNMGQDSPTEIANAADLQRRLASEASGEAETARLASGRPNQGNDAQTEAETPRANIERIGDAGGDAGGPKAAGESHAAQEAVERATSGLGTP